MSGSASEMDLDALGRVAAYQFGPAGSALFDDPDLEITRSSSGRPRQIIAPDGRIGTYSTTGRFTLGVAGGRRLQELLPHPDYRVVVGDDSEPFVRDEKNVFAKFVREVDSDIRPGDEVLVTHQRGELLAVGRAELPAGDMLDFETGMAVAVREGAED